jgi:catechol 2,3-dioxygenase-like lactoylglutathione lyase family enzyme
MPLLTDAPPVAFILTADRDKAEVFYGDVLGLKQTGKDPFATSYDLAGTLLRLTSVPGHVPGPHTVIGWQVPDIRATIAELKAKGVAMMIYDGFGQDADGVWSDPGRGTKIAWFNDPEGNNLSLTERNA